MQKDLITRSDKCDRGVTFVIRERWLILKKVKPIYYVFIKSFVRVVSNVYLCFDTF